MSRSRRMLIFPLLLFAGITLTGLAATHAKQDSAKPQDQFASGTPLPAADKKHLLKDSFVIVRTVAAIPRPVQKKILGTGVRDGMADAGQPYQATDDITSPEPLPSRRLLFAGTSPGYCFVYNEQGGYGHSERVSLYRLSAGQAVLVWRGSPRGNMNILSLSQLRHAISSGKFDNL